MSYRVLDKHVQCAVPYRALPRSMGNTDGDITRELQMNSRDYDTALWPSAIVIGTGVNQSSLTVEYLNEYLAERLVQQALIERELSNERVVTISETSMPSTLIFLPIDVLNMAYKKLVSIYDDVMYMRLLKLSNGSFALINLSIVN